VGKSGGARGGRVRGLGKGDAKSRRTDLIVGKKKGTTATKTARYQGHYFEIVLGRKLEQEYGEEDARRRKGMIPWGVTEQNGKDDGLVTQALGGGGAKDEAGARTNGMVFCIREGKETVTYPTQGGRGKILGNSSF